MGEERAPGTAQPRLEGARRSTDAKLIGERKRADNGLDEELAIPERLADLGIAATREEIDTNSGESTR